MFALPLSTDTPIRRTPVVTRTIIGLCVAVFAWQTALPPEAAETFVYGLGMVPRVLTGRATLDPEITLVPSWASVVTSMFLHGGWLHLLGNMVYLWIFGNAVEDSMTRPRFMGFYLVCGVAAALAQAAAAPRSPYPMIGASGAIAGVLGAYLVLCPRANVRTFVLVLIFFRVVDIPAVVVLLVWFAGQILSGALAPAQDTGIAFWAHIAGFVAGVALIPLFRRRGTPLFRARVVHGRQRGSVPTVTPGSHPGRWRGPLG